MISHRRISLLSLLGLCLCAAFSLAWAVCPPGSALEQDGRCHVACTIPGTVWNGSACVTANTVQTVDCQTKYGGTAYENNYGQCVLMPYGQGKVCPKGTCFNGTSQLCQSYCPLNTVLTKIKKQNTTDLNTLISDEQNALKSYAVDDGGQQPKGGIMPVSTTTPSGQIMSLTQAEWDAHLKSESAAQKADYAKFLKQLQLQSQQKKTQQAAMIAHQTAQQKAQAIKNAALDKAQTPADMQKLYTMEEQAIIQRIQKNQGQNPGMLAVSVLQPGGHSLSLTQSEWNAYLKQHPTIAGKNQAMEVVTHTQALAQAAANAQADAKETPADMQQLYQKEEQAIQNSMNLNGGQMPDGMIDVSVQQSGGHTLQLTQAEWDAYLKTHQNIAQENAQLAAKDKNAAKHPFRLAV